MGLMDIALLEDGTAYSVPGVGVVPRASTLLDLLDHPAKRRAIQQWREDHLVRGAVNAARWMNVTAEEITPMRAAIYSQMHEARDRGVMIHELAEDEVTGRYSVPGWGPRVREELDNLGYDEHVWRRTEHPIYSTTWGVAGTLDLAWMTGDGRAHVVDWKTGKNGERRRWTRQLMIYADGVAWPMAPDAVHLHVIRICPPAGDPVSPGTRVTTWTLHPEDGDYAALDAAAATLAAATNHHTHQHEEK